MLRKYELYGRIAARKPLLNDRHVRNRINWCKSYAKVRTSFWNDVIFSDESRLELFSRRREYVRRPKGLRFEDRYATKTVKFGEQSLMAWGAIKEDGSRILIRCPHRMNSVGYKDVLKKGLLPIYEAHNIFQHDSASCHTSGFISSFMEKKGICLLSDWPDLSIIEPLWSDLKARVASCRPSNIDEL